MIELDKGSAGYTIRPKDFEDGHAYMSNLGDIFIGNGVRTVGSTDTIAGFSLDGSDVVFREGGRGANLMFREVNLKVRVEG